MPSVNADIRSNYKKNKGDKEAILYIPKNEIISIIKEYGFNYKKEMLYLVVYKNQKFIINENDIMF